MSVASPTPSLESLSGTPLGSLIDSELPRSLDTSPPASSTSSLGGRNSPVNTQCGSCNETLVHPRLLSCLHVCCLSCLERVSDGGDRVPCPLCREVTFAPPELLLPDYALHRLLEAPVDRPASCTACKSRDAGAAVARCIDCSKLLCNHCVTAHNVMLCFQTHRVMTLSELAHRDERPVTCPRHKNEPLKYLCVTCSTPVCADCTLVDHPKGMHECEPLDEAAPRYAEKLSVYAEDARVRASDMRTCIKSVENSMACLQQQYQKAQVEIDGTFTYYMNMVEHRKVEILQELTSLYRAKELSLKVLAQKTHECSDKLIHAVAFVDKMRKYANSTEVAMVRKVVEERLRDLMAKNFDLGMQNVTDLEFVSNYSAIETGVRNTYGYIRSSSDIQVGPTKMPPIARPNSASVSSMNSINSLNGLTGLSTVSSSLNGVNSSIPNRPITNGHHLTTSLTNGLSSALQTSLPGSNGHVTLTNGIHNGLSSGLGGGALNGNLNGGLDRSAYTANQLSSLLSKRFSGNSTSYTSQTALPDFNLNGVGGYEKWSSAGEGGSVFGNDGSAVNGLTNGLANGLSNGLNSGMSNCTTSSDSLIHDLSSRMLSFSVFPQRSQIKRHKMIYHCKFGEFGVLEGQFTEPSGAAVNAQNDIIVADTNNHRIQIFDKEGRFKFQFGECGKRDGQLLYPNRVAVVRTSGDIIVTERSPTHQIQIYNQYGQFVRKFGANTLCYPRGVAVDHKGRIIVVECKVMRVIIFDQYGIVLNQFNCPNHLEFPNGVVVNDKQEIFISDNRAHCVKVFSYEGQYLRQIGGEGITNYPIGVAINSQGEILIADNHNNFNLTLFTQDGQLVSAHESKVKHAQCFDVALMDDGSVVLASKDYRVYVYRYLQVPPPHI